MHLFDGLHRLAHAAALVVTATDVGRHVGEQQILLARVPDRSFGEGEAAGQPVDRRVEIDQVGKLATQRGVTHRDLPRYAGNQLRRGNDWTTGPGTASCRRPTTCPASISAGRSWTGSTKRDEATTFLIAAFSCRLVVP